MTEIRPKLKFFLRTTAVINSREEHYAQKELIFGNVGDWVAHMFNHSFLDDCPKYIRDHYRAEDKIIQLQNIYKEKDWDLSYNIDLPIDKKPFTARIEYKAKPTELKIVPNTMFCTCIELFHKEKGWEVIKEREIELKREKKWLIFPTNKFKRCEDCYLRGE